jgi:hypothetical protein
MEGMLLFLILDCSIPAGTITFHEDFSNCDLHAEEVSWLDCVASPWRQPGGGAFLRI